MNSLPDWKLPPGTSRGVMAYVGNAGLAKTYDRRLAGTPLLQYDLRFAERILSPPGRLLDLGCGTGRLLVRLAQLGHSAVGVDLSAEMLKVAGDKLRSSGLTASLIRANLVELDCLREGVFDHAACLFSTLGMIVGNDNRRQMLAHVLRVLKPGGRFVLHVHNRGFHVWTRTGRQWSVRDWWKRQCGEPDAGDFEMPPHEGIAGLSLHHFTRGEIVRGLTQVGFRVVCVEPVSTRADCRLSAAWWAGRWRAYGYFIAAEKVRAKVVA